MNPNLADDVLLQRSGPEIEWSRVNIATVVLGVQTPLSWCVWDETERSFRLAYTRLKLLPKSDLQVPPISIISSRLSFSAGRRPMSPRSATPCGPCPVTRAERPSEPCSPRRASRSRRAGPGGWRSASLFESTPVCFPSASVACATIATPSGAARWPICPPCRDRRRWPLSSRRSKKSCRRQPSKSF